MAGYAVCTAVPGEDRHETVLRHLRTCPTEGVIYIDGKHVTIFLDVTSVEKHLFLNPVFWEGLCVGIVSTKHHIPVEEPTIDDPVVYRREGEFIDFYQYDWEGKVIRYEYVDGERHIIEIVSLYDPPVNIPNLPWRKEGEC